MDPREENRPVLQPIDQQAGLGADTKKPSPKRRLHPVLWVLLGCLALIVAAIVAVIVWYNVQLTPVNSNDQSRVRLEVESGMSPDAIASRLEEQGLIRNSTAFLVYTRLQGVQNQLQAGVFSISPSESVADVTNHLLNGESDEFSITFLPGATIDQHKKVLEQAGYDTAEIDRAFEASYDHPLLKTKPASASLEGYIYGETYQIASGSTVEMILEKTFDQFYAEIEAKGLEASLQTAGYDLHRALTFASIIQREERIVENQRRVAGVFINRLAIDMPLQSDPTFIYGARLLGEPETNAVDSPYNTYKINGLPPGPIASPSVTALEAILDPEPSDFLYFLSGDDDQLYFARTLDEHEQNIQNHCQQKCFSY